MKYYVHENHDAFFTVDIPLCYSLKFQMKNNRGFIRQHNSLYCFIEGYFVILTLYSYVTNFICFDLWRSSSGGVYLRKVRQLVWCLLLCNLLLIFLVFLFVWRCYGGYIQEGHLISLSNISKRVYIYIYIYILYPRHKSKSFDSSRVIYPYFESFIHILTHTESSFFCIWKFIFFAKFDMVCSLHYLIWHILRHIWCGMFFATFDMARSLSSCVIPQINLLQILQTIILPYWHVMPHCSVVWFRHFTPNMSSSSSRVQGPWRNRQRVK